MTNRELGTVTPLSWRFWVVVILLLAAYFVCGASSFIQLHADLWLYRIGLSASTIVSVIFVFGWTIYGLFQRAARWWRTDLGASLVIVIASAIPGGGALAWTFDFQSGVLHPGWVAWFALNGPLVKAVALLWVGWLWRNQLLALRSRLRNGETQ